MQIQRTKQTLEAILVILDKVPRDKLDHVLMQRITGVTLIIHINGAYAREQSQRSDESLVPAFAWLSRRWVPIPLSAIWTRIGRHSIFPGWSRLEYDVKVSDKNGFT
jgi:hypothetical protein